MGVKELPHLDIRYVKVDQICKCKIEVTLFSSVTSILNFEFEFLKNSEIWLVGLLGLLAPEPK